MAIDPLQLLSLPPREVLHRFNRRDTILYALGVGAGQVPNEDELRFVYEPQLEALPTMAVILSYPGFWQMLPEYGIDWKRVLHAEQSCDFHQSLPVEGEVRGEWVIDAVEDKGAEKGCLLRCTRRIFESGSNKLLATIRQISWLRGDGGCGTHGDTIATLARTPEREPDSVIDVLTRPEQALLYRLSGDYNPLHADPAVAAAAGFPGPILHGLCTQGIAGRAILGWGRRQGLGRMRHLDCRFTAPVFPGDRLRLDLWNLGGGEIAYRAVAPDRNVTVLNCGRAAFEIENTRTKHTSSE
jgi:acyl dehydratase